MSSRRSFIKKASLISAGLPLISSSSKIADVGELSDKGDWKGIADLFFKHPMGTLNFNTGSAGMMPAPIYDAYIKHVKSMANQPAYQVKTAHEDEVSAARQAVAALIGATKKETTLVRNTSEGIGSILNYYPFEPGDEVVIANTAYPYPHYILDRLCASKGIKKVVIKLDKELDKSDELIAKAYEQVVTSKTKLIISTHILHREGQIMPIKAITKMAHAHNVEVLVDAAHALGQIPHKVSDLDCDYYITSMHKWLYAPLGSGLLFMKEAHITKIDSGFSYPTNVNDSISKYDYTGTIAFQNAMTLPAVMDFHKAIGADLKFQRLYYLATYLREGLSQISGLRLRAEKDRSAAIVSFSLDKAKYSVLINSYQEQYNIHVKKTGYKGDGMIRATVNLHLTETDLDKFIQATAALARKL